MPVRVAAASIAAGVLAGSVVLSLTWLFTPAAYWFVAFAAIVPYALGGYLVAVVLLLAVRRGAERPQRRWLTGGTVLGLAGLVLHAGLLAPAYLGAHAEGEPDLVVMTLNLRHGGGDAGRTVRLVRDHHVDLLVLEELTPPARERLRAAGLDEELPHLAGSPRTGDSGTMVFSAYPLSDAAPLPVRTGALQVRVAARKPFELFALHTSQPLDNTVRWRDDWDAIRRAVEASSGPRLVVGDFNATLDHRPVRDLLDDGFSDAARESNAGWQPTWPSKQGHRWLPGGFPLIAIDHLLMAGGFRAIRTDVATVKGTDHRALVAQVRW